MKQSKSLVFFGSGPVGTATLAGLIGSGFDIEAIITKPKPVHHRGVFPVLELAKKREVAVYTPASRQELAGLFQKERFNSQLGLVVDYGLIIPQGVIDSFRLGIVNSHFSLLPQWRGADPITFAILSGQEKTGVSLMLIDESLDTGPLLAQADYRMEPGETIVSLTRNLVELSSKMIAQILPAYLEGKVVPVAQDMEQKPTYSRKLTKEDGILDWGKPAVVLEREVRAFLGWPKSRARLLGHDVIITKARLAKDQNDGSLVVKCSPGWLEIQELIAPSGRTVSGADFLRGYKKG